MKGLAPSRPKKAPSPHKLKLLCSFGGAFVPRHPTGELRYVGGETRLISVDRRGINLSKLLSGVSVLRPYRPFSLKYQLRGPSSSSCRPELLSISTDDDVRRMIEDHDKLAAYGTVSRLRLFLCDVAPVSSFPRYVEPRNPNWITGVCGFDYQKRALSRKGDAFLGRNTLGVHTRSPRSSLNGFGHQRTCDGRFCVPKFSYGMKSRLNSSRFGHQTHFNLHAIAKQRPHRNIVNYASSCLYHDVSEIPMVYKQVHSHVPCNNNNPFPAFQLPIEYNGIRHHGMSKVHNLSDLNRDVCYRNLYSHCNVANKGIVANEAELECCVMNPRPNLTQLDDNPPCGMESLLNLSIHNLSLSPSTEVRSSMSYLSLMPPRHTKHFQLNKGSLVDSNPFNLGPLSVDVVEDIDDVYVDGKSNICTKGEFELKCPPKSSRSLSLFEEQISIDMINDGAYSWKDQETMSSNSNLEEKVNVEGSRNTCSERAGESGLNILTRYAHLANDELQTIKNSDLEEIRELGSGAHGTVFYGKWKGSDVAIKRLKASCCFSGDELEQDRLAADFWKEARLLGQLQHPNVVAFYGVVTDGTMASLATVTEYMVNGSLKQVLQRKDRTIDRRKRLIIAMDAAFGMEYLHEKNVVHFDLKSHNLLVNMKDPHRPVCKIGDLGLSKVKQRTLVSGGVRGTIPWMAPELVKSRNNMVSEKVDVYSFGVVMWELLTGEEPYHNMRSEEIIAGIIEGCLRPEIPSWCDPAWRSMMEKCWSSDPDARPTFSEIAKELRAIAASANIK